MKRMNIDLTPKEQEAVKKNMYNQVIKSITRVDILNELEKRLNGVPFDKKEVVQSLNGIEDYIVGATPIVIAEKLFN